VRSVAALTLLPKLSVKLELQAAVPPPLLLPPLLLESDPPPQAASNTTTATLAAHCPRRRHPAPLAPTFVVSIMRFSC